MLMWCWFLLLLFGETKTKSSKACYGTPLNDCTTHTLRCKGPLVISITNITFGYRQGCSAVGVANCLKTKCCREMRGDCFTPYNQTLLSQLQHSCSGISTCTLDRNNGLNERSSSCQVTSTVIFHSYSKITYQCATNTPSLTPQPTTETTLPSATPQPTTETTPPSPTPQPTTDTTSPSATSQPTTETSLVSTVSTNPFNPLSSNQASTSLTNRPGPAADTKNTSDAGGIVGGIVGVILVIGIICAIIFFIKRRADKKPEKDIIVNQNGSHQSDTTLPRTTTHVYYELEKNSDTARPNSDRPTSGDNYDYIGKNNNVKHSTGNDIYNHIGINGVTSDDEYHHLKGHNSNKPSVPDSNYNHIGSFSVAEDNYQHIGDNIPRIITEDTYNHIGGHDNTGLDSDDYHHIGGSHEHQVVTDGTYNHIGGDHKEILGNDEYHHIGNGTTQPIITDGEYSHIGGTDVLEGEYSLAKDI